MTRAGRRGRTRRPARKPPRSAKPKGKPAQSQIILRKLGERIRNLRKRRGLTQDELAQVCGSKTALKLAKVERGEVNLSLSTIVHLTTALQTTIARLFRGIP